MLLCTTLVSNVGTIISCGLFHVWNWYDTLEKYGCGVAAKYFLHVRVVQEVWIYSWFPKYIKGDF